jgi:hypothetical protein
MTILALAAIVTTVAVPAGAYYLTTPRNDPLGDTLRGYGFVPINPPSNLINVGSLYYVDSGVKEFTTICNAEISDLENAVVSSRSWQMQESLERNDGSPPASTLTSAGYSKAASTRTMS